MFDTTLFVALEKLKTSLRRKIVVYCSIDMQVFCSSDSHTEGVLAHPGV